MTTLSELFPSNEILKPGQTRDPARLRKFYSAQSASIVSGTATFSHLGSTTGWTYLAASGARTTTATDDTYTTICDITGSGTLYGVVSHSPTNVTDVISFKITVDGVETVVTVGADEDFPAAGSDAYRVFLGGFWDAPGGLYTSFSSNPGSWGNGAFSSSFTECPYYNASGQPGTILPIEIQEKYGTSRLIFDTSLKVEVKVTDVYVGGIVGAYAGAMYVLGEN